MQLVIRYLKQFKNRVIKLKNKIYCWRERATSTIYDDKELGKGIFQGDINNDERNIIEETDPSIAREVRAITVSIKGLEPKNVFKLF